MNNRTQKYGLVKNTILLISLTNIIAYPGLLLASSPITDLITSTTTATPLTYTAGGNTYNWGSIGAGNGIDVRLDGFNLGVNSYFPVSLANSVTIRRVDNGVVSGTPCGIFAEKSSNFNLTTTYPEDSVGNGNCDMEAMIGGNIISRGGLDVFDNVDSTKAKNIERVDFIFTNGITAPVLASDLDEAGHVVTEKSGNNPVQIAVILTLDGAGQPLTYGPLRTVDQASNSPDVAYGIYSSVPATSFDFLANKSQAEPRGFPTRVGGSNERLGSAFVTLDDLGVGAGQTYFGFSYFSADVVAGPHTLSDPATFPDDTSNNDGDADMYGGTSGYFQLSTLIDTDNDGIPNSIDLDDDNDGIPDTVEQATAINGGDTDGDGVLDELDLDADGDGISDLVESGVSAADIATLDGDNNGAIDPASNVGANGLANLIEDVDTPAAVITYNGGSPLDTDGDGRFDFQDLDSDNDGLHDLFESGLDPTVFDSNNDGVVDDNGVDADSDGLSDSIDANDAAFGGINTDPVDSDNDGAADFRDLDSDSDGIHDLVEAGVVDPAVVDTDNDGVLDNPLVDADGDGIPDSGDTNDGVYGDPQTDAVKDTDGDNVPDYQDLDSDNDGIHDLVEAGVVDPALVDIDNDGVLDNPLVDADGDGIPDSGDTNDGVYGDPQTDAVRDTDGDTVPDYQDLDSDNDGIHDLTESGVVDPALVDTDNDGVLDNPLVDADGDGVPDSGDTNDSVYGDPQTNAVRDTDTHGVPDYRDLDSDNDSINDIVESGNGAADTDGDGVADNPTTDTDGDGVPDSIDTNVNTFGDPDAALPDADADGTPDARETDSNNDGTNDIVDNGFGGLDTNGDGVIDVATDTDGDGIPDVTDGSNGFGGGPDLDLDGIPDINDIDDDNDGIPDTVEQATAINGGDTDGDGVPDDRDLDADGDGISDIVESGLTPAQIIAFDANNDGVIDATVPVGINGLANAIETDDTITALLDQDGDGNANDPVDTDNDSRPDFQDLDADNDGIHDLIEVGGLHPDPLVVDADNNGVIDDNGIDADQDGIPDSIDTNDALLGGLSSSPVDTDGDNVANFRDIDSDSDGITDLYESGIFPDTTVVDTDNDGVLDNPLVDADGDGIPDSGDSIDGTYGDPQGTAVVDTDSDNVPDYLDLDSDNDSIPDVTEAGNQDDDSDGLLDPGGTVNFPPTNTDGLDNPDHLDLDSNNDGTNDIDDAGNGGFDTDNDGKVDGSDDADEDGVLDPVDGEPGAFGINADADGDGIPNSIDLDDDNDGIPDIAEKDASGNDVDTDSDGIVDRLDLDSDNDGIPDSVEAITTVLDADADGVIDNFIDANNDGLDDRVSPALIPVDTDSDGTPDFRDLDSDNDGLTDLYEANGFTNAGDSDGDGILDDLTDLDKDGLADVVDPDVVGGTAGTKLPNPDTDGDGISNYREVDSDGDGISDNDENVDADGDGILDNLQPDNIQKDDERLETAVNGIGSFGPMSLLAMLFLGFTRLLRSGRVNVLLQKNKLAAISSVLLMLTTFSATASSDINYCGRHNPLNSDTDEDFKKCFYIGAGYLFKTHVHPRGEAKTWKTSDDSDAGYNIYLGWHFKPRWFGELSYADLGDAGLSRTAPSPAEGEISYKIPSLHIGYWLFEPENRFNVYVKAGLSAISNKETPSEIPFEKQNSVNLTGGIGVQWRSQTSGLFARLAADFYDRDAASVGINVGYYFGRSEKRKQVVVAPKPVPVVAPDPVVAAPVVIVPVDNDNDGVIDKIDKCLDSKLGAVVDSRGCEVIDLSLHGVKFRTNSAALTSQSRHILDKAAATLVGAPHVRVEVQAHTCNLGRADYNEGLSGRRALTVRDYLVKKGVSIDRMEANGYGESQPIASNETKAGRHENRRVELLIID